MMAKFGPLDNSADCAGVSGLDDKLMMRGSTGTHKKH